MNSKAKSTRTFSHWEQVLYKRAHGFNNITQGHKNRSQDDIIEQGCNHQIQVHNKNTML